MLSKKQAEDLIAAYGRALKLLADVGNILDARSVQAVQVLPRCGEISSPALYAAATGLYSDVFLARQHMIRQTETMT